MWQSSRRRHIHARPSTERIAVRMKRVARSSYRAAARSRLLTCLGLDASYGTGTSTTTTTNQGLEGVLATADGGLGEILGASRELVRALGSCVLLGLLLLLLALGANGLELVGATDQFWLAHLQVRYALKALVHIHVVDHARVDCGELARQSHQLLDRVGFVGHLRKLDHGGEFDVDMGTSNFIWCRRQYTCTRCDSEYPFMCFCKNFVVETLKHWSQHKHSLGSSSVDLGSRDVGAGLELGDGLE